MIKTSLWDNIATRCDICKEQWQNKSKSNNTLWCTRVIQFSRNTNGKLLKTTWLSVWYETSNVLYFHNREKYIFPRKHRLVETFSSIQHATFTAKWNKWLASLSNILSQLGKPYIPTQTWDRWWHSAPFNMPLQHSQVDSAAY